MVKYIHNYYNTLVVLKINAVKSCSGEWPKKFFDVLSIRYGVAVESQKDVKNGPK